MWIYLTPRVIESQNILSWNGPTRIIKSNFWLNKGQPKIKIISLRKLSKYFLKSIRFVLWQHNWGACSSAKTVFRIFYDSMILLLYSVVCVRIPIYKNPKFKIICPLFSCSTEWQISTSDPLKRQIPFCVILLYCAYGTYLLCIYDT